MENESENGRKEERLKESKREQQRERDESDERVRGAAWWVRLTKFQKAKQSVGLSCCHYSVGLRFRW
jgi:hypothetical protein